MYFHLNCKVNSSGSRKLSVMSVVWDDLARGYVREHEKALKLSYNIPAGIVNIICKYCEPLSQRRRDPIPNIWDRPLDPSVAKKFVKDPYHRMMGYTKPDVTEFKNLATMTSVAFLLMGFIGYFIRLIHIPINVFISGSK